MDWCPVEGGAGALAGDKQLISHRVIDDADHWERAAAAMYIPFDDRRGIHPQDAHFLGREVWDLDATMVIDEAATRQVRQTGSAGGSSRNRRRRR